MRIPGALSPEEKETIAFDAERLARDPAFARAMSEIDKQALEALITVDPADTLKVMEYQAIIKVVRGLTYRLAVAMEAGKGRVPMEASNADNRPAGNA